MPRKAEHTEGRETKTIHQLLVELKSEPYQLRVNLISPL